MAFQPQGLSPDELNLHKDHSRLITGTGAAILLGHGYREEGDVSHMESILRLYAKMRGDGVARKKSNRAMQVGIELEPIAFDHLKEVLHKNGIEGYEGLMTFDALAGMRLDDTDGSGYGYGANIDAPLINTKGEKQDPLTGEVLPMAAYASKWARLEKDRQSIIKSNELRRSMGEEEILVPGNPLPEPPYAGAGDLKATMQYDVRLEVDHTGPYDGWVIQLHHYNAALKARNAQNGYDNEEYPNALMIGHLYTGDMQTNVHPVPFDPKLENEIFRRSEVFLQCVKAGVSPDSPSMKSNFRPFPVKKHVPTAKLASVDLEEELNQEFEQLDSCDEHIKHWESVKQATESRLLELYEREIDKPGQLLYANKREVQFKQGTRASSQLNKDAIDGVIEAAAAARSNVSEAIEHLINGDSHSALAKLQGIKIDKLPPHNVRNIDAYEVPITNASMPKFTVKSTKKAAKVYEQLCAKADRASKIEALETEATIDSPAAKKKPELEKTAADPKLDSRAHEAGIQVDPDASEPLYVPPALMAMAPRPHNEQATSDNSIPNDYSQENSSLALPVNEPEEIKVKPVSQRVANPFAR